MVPKQRTFKPSTTCSQLRDDRKLKKFKQEQGEKNFGLKVAQAQVAQPSMVRRKGMAIFDGGLLRSD
jgi:hypothetical protein